MTDFDFINEEDNEIATGGSPNEGKEKKKEESTHRGKLTAEVITEARRLAESKKGLDINAFFIRHQLVRVSLDNLLHGKLDKDGCLL